MQESISRLIHASFKCFERYALYYDGPFEPYAPLVRTENPIYVAKADPANRAAKTPESRSNVYPAD